MNITIQSVNFKAGSTLEYFIMEKVGKLFRLNDHIIRAEVTLRQADSGNPQNKSCEIRLLIPGNDHIVSKSTELYEKSILQSVKTLKQVLSRSKPSKMLQKMSAGLYKVFTK